MILGRLKQAIFVGAATLAYLQGASCDVSKEDMQTIRDYWSDRVGFIEEEINIRNTFLEKVKTLDVSSWTDTGANPAEEDDDLDMEVNYKAWKDNLDELPGKIKHLAKKTAYIVKGTEALMHMYDRVNNTKFADEKEENTAREEVRKKLDLLKAVLLSALWKENMIITEDINGLSFDMMRVIKKCNEVKKNKLNGTTLFKLAEKNKMLAYTIILAFFEQEPSRLDAIIDSLISMYSSSRVAHIPKENLENFRRSIKKDIKKNGTDLLALAARYFHLIFDKKGSKSSVLDENTLEIYLYLQKEGFSTENMDCYRNITPAQVVKVLVLEQWMGGNLLGHKNNSIFRTLGKVVEAVFNPKNNSNNIYEGIKIGREKQDKILDVLSMLWKDCSSAAATSYVDLEKFCKENGIELSNIERVQNSLASAKWMYNLTIYTNENSYARRLTSLLGGIDLDVSYIHPIWHVYQRCEHIGYLAEPGFKSRAKLFLQKNDNVVVLRPYLIRSEIKEAMHATHIQGCIKAWLSPSAEVEIVVREEDNKEYKGMANDFVKYMSNTQGKRVSIKYKAEKEEEISEDNDVEVYESTASTSLFDEYMPDDSFEIIEDEYSTFPSEDDS
ncbi:hypothetical protein NEMIN01_0346 [Nematocida minor]|uniref:uncharacterized protein n=1 Tax=Nematocida minor TaxID=1912983 RepID=UPI00221E51E4|nr:uncharacterized protein NEMIN01_0346 [Nematocida minor]KAI5189180.1 hypothetical protein NEMIN01_0346 [Nematocida minor]